MRRICYVSGTRADFGLMARTLKLASEDSNLDVSVCVTGMHLSALYGHTVDEIAACGLRISGRIPVDLDGTIGAVMARALGHELIGIVDVFVREQPDLVVVLGDRGEMLAGALAAIHLNIPVVHIHGGERSGTVDEPVRHAISKLSHYHFVATEGARQRLIKLGERQEHVIVTGAPGLDEIVGKPSQSRHEWLQKAGFDPAKPVVLVVFHPVVQEAESAGTQMGALLDALADSDLQALILRPNADAGGAAIDRAILDHTRRWRTITHLSRGDFIAWLASVDVMVGNSSSGIIEAASVGLRVVNVGTRQRLRERSGNVIDVEPERMAIRGAISQALASGPYTGPNVYGHGDASVRIMRLLSKIPVDVGVLQKTNAY